MAQSVPVSGDNLKDMLSFAGQFIATGSTIDITLPWDPDSFEMWNYTKYGTAAQSVKVAWFRDMPAGDALIDIAIVDNGSTGNSNFNLETTNGITENDTASAVTSSNFAISGATAASPVVLTMAAHGITVGSQVRARVTDVLGMVELDEISRNPYLAESVTSTTVKLMDLDGNNLDGTAFTAYTSGGKFNNLSHDTSDDQGAVNYAPAVYKLTLGTAVDFNDSDVIYFRAMRYNSYTNLGDAANF